MKALKETLRKRLWQLDGTECEDEGLPSHFTAGTLPLAGVSAGRGSELESQECSWLCVRALACTHKICMYVPDDISL